MESRIYRSEKQVYEAYGLRADGTVFGIETLEAATDDEAILLAREYAALWASPVKLYRVPFLNITSRSSFDLWPDEIKFLAVVERSPWLRVAMRAGRGFSCRA